MLQEEEKNQFPKVIPWIIHQTWKDQNIPQRFKPYVRSWRNHHPDWEYRLWDDAANRNFIRTQHHWFLPIYDNYSLNIQRADAIRYFILYTYGGLYVDLDFECFKPVEPLLEGKKCVFGIESPEHSRRQGIDQIISNAFMAAIPKHPFFYAVMKHLVTDMPEKQDFGRFVLETTGPLMLSRLLANFQNGNDITLMPSEYLFPLDMDTAEQFLAGHSSPQTDQVLKNAYAVHYHCGSWWKEGHVEVG